MLEELPEIQVSRRSILTAAAAAALAGVLPRDAWSAESGTTTTVPAPATRRTVSSEITATTIAEAEKIHAVSYTDAERRALLQTLPGQVQGVRALHRLPLDRDLQPACMFDPRLPGVEYRTQTNDVRLSRTKFGPLPTKDDDIAYASVAEQAYWIRTKQVTSRRLTEIYLDRVHRIDRKLFSYITVTEAVARQQAACADREIAEGRYRGLLHGIPYGLKDVFDTQGIKTTWGSALYRDRIPTEDASVAIMLREAGAVLLGKLATGELANGVAWYGGMCRNPWNTDEPAGGSSCGPGAATAAALCSFAIGTDSLGSILNPADRCGITGLRATYGRVPVRGGMPLTPSLERIGPLTRSVEDAALVMAAINGNDRSSAGSIDMGFAYDGNLDVRKLKVGYNEAWFKKIGFGSPQDIDVRKPHRDAFKALQRTGVRLVEVDLPKLPYELLLSILFVEAGSVFGDLSLSGQDDRLLNQEAYGWPNNWRQIRLLSAVDYYTLERFRRQVMQEMHKVFSEVDALFSPTYGSFALFMIMNFTGHPGITLRAGLDRMPTRAIAPNPIDPRGPERTVTQNVSFHGRLFEEGKIIALARALERELGVARYRPDIG